MAKMHSLQNVSNCPCRWHEILVAIGFPYLSRPVRDGMWRGSSFYLYAIPNGIVISKLSMRNDKHAAPLELELNLHLLLQTCRSYGANVIILRYSTTFRSKGANINILWYSTNISHTRIWVNHQMLYKQYFIFKLCIFSSLQAIHPHPYTVEIFGLPLYSEYMNV